MKKITIVFAASLLMFASCVGKKESSERILFDVSQTVEFSEDFSMYDVIRYDSIFVMNNADCDCQVFDTVNNTLSVPERYIHVDDTYELSDDGINYDTIPRYELYFEK